MSSRRAAALAGAAGIAALGNRVGATTGIIHQGPWGAFLARLDLAPVLLLVVAGFTLYQPVVAARTAGRVVAWREVLPRFLAITYLTWWSVLVVDVVTVDPTISARRWLATALLFRDPRDGGPVAGLGIGVLVLTVVLFAIALPLLDRVVAGDRRRESAAIVAMAGTGLAYRLAVTASGRTSLFGALSWLPNHLDALAAGMAVAVVAERGLRGGPERVRAVRLAGAAAAVAAFALAAATLNRAPIPDTKAGLIVRSLLALVVGTGVAAATLLQAPSDGPAGSRLRTLTLALAVASPGLVLCSEAVFIMIARQYTVEVVETGGGLFLQGPAAGPFVWTVAVAAALGVLLTTLVVMALRAGQRRWPVPSYGLALASVVAVGLVVRMVGLLHIAPQRTDDGDPLYYHTTANLLAHGRGFPEPLQWIAFGTFEPGAVHGPLYPVVLSFSSRLGATDWFDHKMLSVLIGTATVLVTGLVARRLGGRIAGLLAALFAAVYPNLWLIDSLMFPEGLFALLTTLSILLAYRWRDRPGRVTAILLGAVIGLAALTRGEGLLLGPLLAMPWMLRTRALPLATRWKHLVIAGAACTAVVAPWTIRNTMSFENFVPLSTNSNELILYANCPDVYSGPLIGYWSFDCQQRIRAEEGDPPGDASQRAAYWQDRGLDYARDNLGQVPKVLAARVGRQWELFRPIQNVRVTSIEGRNQTYGRLGLGMYYVLAAASVAGVIALRRRRRLALAEGSDGTGDGASTWPLVVQFVCVTLTALYAYGTIRFRAPAEPALCILGAVGAVPLARRFAAWARTISRPTRPSFSADGSAFVLGGVGALRRRELGAWRTWAGIATVLTVVAIPLRGLYQATGGTMEEAFMLYFPERIAKGDVPNVDFLHLYGPGSLYALLGWYKVFGFTLDAERTFGLLQHLGIIFGLFALTRAWGRAAATAVASIATFFVLTQVALTAMAWNGALALGLWAAVFAVRAGNVEDRRSGVRCWAAAGLLAGIALSFRPDMIVAIALSLGWLLWRRRQRWAPLAAGFAVGLIPYVVHFAMAGIRAPLRGMISDPVFHLRAGRELPSPPSWNRLDGSLQAIAETVPPWWRFPAIAASRSIFLWFFLMLALAFGLVIVAWRLYRRTNGSARSVALMAGALFSLGILPQGLQRPDSTHLSWVTCISWPLLLIALVELARTRTPRLHPQARVIGAAGAVVALMFLIAPLFTFRYYVYYTRLGIGDVPAPFLVQRGDRSFYLGDYRPYAATVTAVEDLDRLSQPGQRLFVGPEDLRRTWYSDVFYYYLFPELDPATYYIEMDPGLANAEGSSLADDVASADWVILTGYWNGWREPNASMDYGSDAPNQVVRDQFCLYQNYGDGQVQLFYRCDSPPDEGGG